VGVVELLRRHPLLLFDEHAPRPRQRAAEARQRDLKEGEEEFGVGGDGGRRLQRRRGSGGIGHDGALFNASGAGRPMGLWNRGYERSGRGGALAIRNGSVAWGMLQPPSPLAAAHPLSARRSASLPRLA